MIDMLTNPRDLAYSALRDRAGNVTARLESLLARGHMSPPDRALASEITLGVRRRQATLQAVLRAFLANPDRPLPGPLSIILRIGLYQLLMLDRVPDFAAVNEAVDQTIRLGHKRKAGLVNGVLRTVARGVSPLESGPAPAATDIVPVAPGAYRKLSRPVFADPETQPGDYLAQAFSLPAALATRWLERFGTLAAASEIAVHANARPALILRVNTLKTDVDGAIAALAEEDVEAVPHANGQSIVLPRQGHVARLAAVTGGLVQPQDASATGVVAAAKPKPGSNVLDFCAAPGTKTTHLAALMNNTGSIVAVDVSPEKLRRIEDSCRRMGVTNVTTRLADEAGQLEPDSFDLVLADVPCSNTGVLARRVEARWRFDPGRLGKLAADQRDIAAAAAWFARPGGTLVYSTCSIEPEEGPEVARRLAGREAQLELKRDQMILPGGADDPTRWHDGGYFAIFRAR